MNKEASQTDEHFAGRLGSKPHTEPKPKEAELGHLLPSDSRIRYSVLSSYRQTGVSVTYRSQAEKSCVS